MPMPKTRREDFAGIGGADRGDRVGGLQAAFQVADIAEIFHAAHRIGFRRQPERRQQAGGILALEGEVVDGQHDRRQGSFRSRM